MSNIIPMVSSSPPPMDEGGGFEWDDDDDDFGTFTSASDSSFVQSETSSKQDTSVQDPGAQEINTGGFADFETFSSNELKDTLNKECSKTLTNDHRPESINISHKETSQMYPENNDYHTVNGPLVDSGVYSSNVSPVQHTEHSGAKTHLDHTVDAKNESLPDISGNLKDSLENSVDETVSSCSESKNDLASSVPCVNVSSVAQGNGSLINNTKSNRETELQGESIKCIPPKEDIPENDQIHISGRAKNEEETEDRENDNSANVVIPNCDESNGHYSGKLDTKSSMCTNENSQSASNVSNQEAGHSQNLSQTDLTADRYKIGVDSDNEINVENNYDIVDFSSVSVGDVENVVEDTNISVNKTEQESEEEQVYDSNDIVDQQENFNYITANSEEQNISVQEKPVDGIVKNNDSENANISDDVSQKEKCVDDQFRNHERQEHAAFTFEGDSENAEQNVENKKGEENDAASVSSVKDAISESKDHDVSENDQIENDAEYSLKGDTNHSENMKVTDDTEKNVEPIDTHLLGNNVPVSDNNNSNIDDIDDFGDLSATVNIKVKDGLTLTPGPENNEDKNDDFDAFSRAQVSAGEGFAEFNTSSGKKQDEVSSANAGDDEDDFGDFNASFDQKADSDVSAMSGNNDDSSAGLDNKPDSGVQAINDNDDFGDFNASFDNEAASGNSAVPDTNDDFGDFNTSFSDNEGSKTQGGDQFGDFSATFDSAPPAGDQTSDWAAFSEPQTVIRDDVDDEDDDWEGFEGEESVAASQPVTVTSSSKLEGKEKVSPNLANMTKHEKLLYAVTTCFPALITDLEVCDINLMELTDLHVDNDSHVWGQVKGQQTTEALSYQWTKSLWNTQLFSTLHIDTKNILIGHKKAPVPVFAAGLTLLEPTKGQAALKPDVLIDTSKPDSSLTSHSQIPATSVPRPNKNESIPAAQFDWSSSGLTNPLEGSSHKK